MKATVTVEEFLALEEESRRLARLRAPAREVRRFHAAVRRFATAWCSRPGRRITATGSKLGIFLHLELDDRYDWTPVFSLRALHSKGEFCLRGPNPDRKKVRLSAKLRKAMDNINKIWRAMPGAEEEGPLAVVVHLPKLADASFDRFLETAVQVLDSET